MRLIDSQMIKVVFQTLKPRKWTNNGIIDPLLDGLTCNTCRHFARCLYFSSPLRGPEKYYATCKISMRITSNIRCMYFLSSLNLNSICHQSSLLGRGSWGLSCKPKYLRRKLMSVLITAVEGTWGNLREKGTGGVREVADVRVRSSINS